MLVLTLGEEEQRALVAVLDYFTPDEVEDYQDEEHGEESRGEHILLALVRLQMAVDDGAGVLAARGSEDVRLAADELAGLEQCRDCGRPCSFEKDGEGFHAD